MYIIKVNDIYISEYEFRDYEIAMNFTTNKDYAVRFEENVIDYYISIIESFFYNSDVIKEDIE